VFFGSVTASLSGGSPQSLSVTVPAGAGPGPVTVTVTTPDGTSNGIFFTVTAPATTAAPVLTAPANGSLTNDKTPTYSGTAPAGSTVTVYVDATVSGTTTATGGTFSFTQTTTLADGPHTVYATAQTSGSPVSANGSTNSFTVDATALTLTNTTGSVSNSSDFGFTAVFSEAVKGFTAADVVVSNGGSVINFNGSGTSYSFTVTLPAPAPATVSVPANAAQDAAGNGSAAAGPVSATYTRSVSWNGSVSTDAN
jgi:Bacterial Ig-like domain